MHSTGKSKHKCKVRRRRPRYLTSADTKRVRPCIEDDGFVIETLLSNTSREASSTAYVDRDMRLRVVRSVIPTSETDGQGAIQTDRQHWFFTYIE